ncbi:glutathione peroxidase [Salirhabdus euzebyi]|uniref:Glutathione peroxidase n=1 Tax=Salirhabdus euzebyi TaxID=394506 RepID=A0A841Q8Y1_9BACI|nr:glutathione peroxidase [Salirhabdus euzebyi]MBB6454774.1 glutathione peroxidase [Salirhabdus euzebyi]
MVSIYDFEPTLANGVVEPLNTYHEKVILIVNTASKCGFTPQFEGLQELYKEYKDDGLVVLGFPCGQFMNQEFEDEKDIVQFCQVNYGVDFPMFEKVDVKGRDAHPLFQFLTNEKKGIFGGEIKWNFTKFLIDREGNVVKRYAPNTKPEKIKKDIEKYI